MPRNATAVEVKDRKFGESLPPGGYYFVSTRHHERAGIVHGCPCGCGQNTLMYFRGCALDGAESWKIEGEWPNVTAWPSIGLHKQESGSYGWHGFLENGVFIEK